MWPESHRRVSWRTSREDRGIISSKVRRSSDGADGASAEGQKTQKQDQAVLTAQKPKISGFVFNAPECGARAFGYTPPTIPMSLRLKSPRNAKSEFSGTGMYPDRERVFWPRPLLAVQVPGT